jgi:hypothetical protein
MTATDVAQITFEAIQRKPLLHRHPSKIMATVRGCALEDIEHLQNPARPVHHSKQEKSSTQLLDLTVCKKASYN